MPLQAQTPAPPRGPLAEPSPPLPESPRRTGRLKRDLTPAQAQAVHALGASDGAVLPAATGPDVFVYVERAGATLRFQVGADGGLVGQTRFARTAVERGVA
jgi:hypothetical protein